MNREIYRYLFTPSVPLDEVEATLLLAIWGAESLLGESQVRLDSTHLLNRAKRACAIDAGTPAGRAVNRLFVGFLQREFGGDAFQVRRVEPQEAHS
jgi:hypothetical protein